MLPKLGDHFVNNFHPEGLGGRAPEHDYHDGTHRRPKLGKLLGQLSIMEGGDPHPL
jgi:hypothetical protein